MKAIYLIIASVASFASTAQSQLKWQLIAADDSVRIEQKEVNEQSNPHNNYSLIVRLTANGKKPVEQALIKNYQEDWLESHSDYRYEDGLLRVSIEGTNLIPQENKDPKQEPFKILKCFKLNVAKTSFAAVKCASN